ncbi:unnamed protein product, partial [Nippostrongylus brasiliensis]|uniref:Metalloendopeptidase n=1 Tax=Nippostrongylus brasiliensis TaxID=27835 RepID=A0A0N4XQC9_NIPBR
CTARSSPLGNIFHFFILEVIFLHFFQFGVTSHELAHTLGVFHEQSRYDRDPVVQLNSRVVAPELLFNFAKVNFHPELSSGC